ncbi:MAG: EAL domain-containing protein [Gammaproteobacteria bacterium]|nr:EAL domain-containing protein [Gammaproteobacteria bacterium]
MNINLSLFQSKVAWRMFALFVATALIPVALLALLTFNQVTRHLSKQTQLHLHQNTKSIGLDIFKKLSFLGNELEHLSKQFATEPNDTYLLQQLIRDDNYDKYFTSLGFSSKAANYTPIFGKSLHLPAFTQDQLTHIATGAPILLNLYDQDRQSRLVLVNALHPDDGDSNYIVSEIRQENFWNIEYSLPGNGNFCVFGSAHIALFCSDENIEVQSLRNKLLITNPSVPQFLWQSEGIEYAAYSWPVFLQGAFTTGEWTVVLSIPSHYIYQPLTDFRNIFLPIVILSLLLVAYFSSKQIRRSLTPLEKLKAGTERLAEGDFQAKVNISSGDEFEDLAASFNTMAERIDKQFTSLQIMSEVDRIMLSSLDANYILETVMDRIKDISYCQRALIFKVKGKNNRKEARFQVHHMDKTQPFFRDTIVIESADEHILEANPRYLFVHSESDPPDYLQSLIMEGGKSFIIFPIYLREQLFTLVVLVYTSKIHFEDYDFRHARELADRIAVALTNADWEEKVYRQANFDVLTDLPNRNLLMDRLEQSIQRARRDGTQVAVLLVDLDRFKAINDSLGHNAGDTLLRRVSERLKKIISTADTLVRYGGDEFVVIMSDIKYHTNFLSGITLMAERILDTLMKPYGINEHEINITASIGISLYPSDSRNANDLLKFAESSMYHSKSHKKGFYQFYSSEINATSITQIELENDLRQAIKRDELELYFQPQLNLTKGEIVSAEALVRWNHPDSGIISPDTFLPLAENIGLFIPLSNWVIEQACKQLRSWMDNNKPITQIAINLSAHQFKTENLTKRIQFLLHKYNLDVSLLELEITEDAVMSNINDSILTLRQLNELGVQLAIDDFGTGYSSLSYLTKFPIHFLKIDQSFVREAPDNKSVNSIISATIAMAHSLKLKVIAEGVENKAQLEFLKSLGCDIAQGYLISKPLPAQDYIRLIENSATRYIASSG